MSRDVLDRHNWDLISAINGHMGFEPPVEQPSFQNHNHHVEEAGTSRRLNAGPSGPENAVTRSRRAPIPARRSSSTSLFTWVWKILTAPVEFLFRYLWEFIGFGLQFLRSDPRRGKLLAGKYLECEAKYV